jgi:hypothetical protein
MRNLRYYIVLITVTALSLVMANTGCLKIRTADQQPATLVSDAMLATGVDPELKPVNASNTFYVNTDAIYLSLKLNNASANTQVMVKMTYLGGEASNLANTTMFNQSQSGQGTKYLSFSIKPPPGGFPQGDYQVAISANGVEQVSLPFKVQNLQAQQGWPVISKFSATPATVPMGQSVTLSWDVSDATRVTLQPAIGTIPSSGTRAVTPALTTTYVITASNDAGTTKRELMVTVGAAVAGAPDLVITNIWLEGLMLYYTIKNAGAVDSPPTYTHIYIDNLFPSMGGSSFADVLKPGQEKTLVFSSYQWPYGVETGGVGSWNPDVDQVYDPSLLNHTVKVCADAKNEASEGDEDNNCMFKLWGILWNYDMLAVSHMPTYYNSWDQLAYTEGLNESDPHGAHIKMSDGGLEMVPEQKPQGFLRGKWGIFYQDYAGAIRKYPIKIPAKTKFIARVGLDERGQGSDGVTFKLGFLDSTDTLRFLDSKKMTVPGKFEDWVVDLSDQQGTFGYFLLQVDAGNSPTNDFAIWKEARLKQVN